MFVRPANFDFHRAMLLGLCAAIASAGIGCASNKKAPDLAGPGVNAYYGASNSGSSNRGAAVADANVALAGAQTPAGANKYPAQQAVYTGPPHKRVLTTCGAGCSCH